MSKRAMAIPQVIIELQDQALRESALRCLSTFLLEKREDPENYYRTGFLLYNSCSTIAVLLQNSLEVNPPNRHDIPRHELKRNSTKETVDSLSGDNTRLQAKVMELEESSKYLLRENQQLAESTSGLQSQIQNLEKSIASAHTSTMQPMRASGGEDTNTQMDAAQQLVEKLVTENAELVEKVNELYVELDQQGVTSDLSPDVGSELTAGTAKKIHVADSISEFSERTSAYDERPDSPKHVLIKDTSDGGDGVNAEDIAHIAGSIADSMEDVAIKAEGEDGEYIYAKDIAVIPNSPDTVDSEEIVQIPLDENEVGDPGLQLTHDDQTIHVPITDAPLIGAPFRLISFVARYVSGADLVNKSCVNSETVNSHK